MNFCYSLAGIGVIDLASMKGLATAAGGEVSPIFELASGRRHWALSFGAWGLALNQWYTVQRLA